MTDSFFMQKSMNVTLTDYTYNVIQHDMALFQINQNRILNTIVNNLSGESSADYLLQNKAYQSLIEKIVESCMKEFNQTANNAQATRKRIENLYKEQFYAEKNLPIHGQSMRFTLSKSSVERLYSIPGIPKESLIGYPESADNEPRYKSVTKYLGRLYEAYAKLDLKDREKCIFAENYQIIENAIAEKKCISVNIESGDSCKTLYIKPYGILSDMFTGYYYLVGFAREQSDEIFEISTFRISRLSNPKKCLEDYLSEREVFMLEQKLEQVSPAYLRNDAVEVQVIMTKIGENNFYNILRNRPKTIRKEPILPPSNPYTVKYTFFCTEFQVANYFHQFGADAVIVQPQALHDEQKDWYNQAAQVYHQFI